MTSTIDTVERIRSMSSSTMATGELPEPGERLAVENVSVGGPVGLGQRSW